MFAYILVEFLRQGHEPYKEGFYDCDAKDRIFGK